MAYPGDSCVGIFTNGAPSMVGCIKGFATLVEKQNLYIVRIHCFLHGDVLVSNIEQYELKQATNQVIEMVNFIKTRPLKSRIFELLCVKYFCCNLLLSLWNLLCLMVHFSDAVINA